MFLSNGGGSTISMPINSAVGIGETKVLQANLASNLSSATFVSGNANTVLDTVGNSDWKFYVGPSTSTAAITSSSASSEWSSGSLLSYLEDYYVLYYNFDTTLVSGSNVYNTASKIYDATLVNATVVTTTPSPSVFGLDRGYLVCTAANYLQINGLYTSGLTGTSIATWINVNGAGGDIFNSSDGVQSSIRLFVSGGTSIVLRVSNNAGDGLFETTLYTNAAVNNGSWHHVALVLTPVFTLSTYFTNSSGNSGLAGGVARWQLFFDGVSVFNETWGNINAKYPDYIVRGTNKVGPITALIDDFRVYDMALTTSEIAVLSSRISSWYKFNSAIGNNTIDSINGNTAVLSGGASIQTATPSPVGGGYVSLSSASQQYITIPQFAVGGVAMGHSFFFKTVLSNAHKILTSFSISQLNKYITFGIVGNSVYLNMNLTNGIAYSAGGGTFQSGFTTFSNLTSNTGGDIAVSVDDKIMVTHTGFNASVAQSILVSNFSGSTWGVPTSIGSMVKLWNLAMTSDGKRIVATQKGGYVFVSMWNGTSYSAFVQTSDATSRIYTGLGMTADGSRIVCCTNESGPSGNVYMALWNEATNNYNAFTTIVTGISTSIGYDTMCISVDGYKIAYSSGTTGYWASWNGTAYVQQTSFTCVTALNMKFTIDANILLMTTNSATSAIYSVFFNGTTFLTLTAYGQTTVLLNKNLLGFHVNVSSYFYLSENGVVGGPYRNRVYWGTSYRTYRCNTITDNNWHNIYFNFYSPYYFEYWFDGTNLTATDVLTNVDPNFGSYYANNTITTNYVGRSLNSPLTFFDGSIDDLRFYNRRLSTAEASFLITGKMNIPQITAGASGPTWMPTPATLVDSTETNYTIKSNEIALRPGTNSTYAVWTAPKSTNLKIDVSFADYHSRSAGVGFQMFKINSDNTFGSVIFPRTVTSTALTNAAPTNYLSVPSRSLSVATGDKIYYRIDANGNATAASSVLATNIYVDPNQDLKQFKYLQAHLGNNIAATSFVGGNANVVNDTLRTGNWNFYVAGNTSVASITGASNSTEWTAGSLLSYDSGNPIILNYEFDAANQVGSTIQNLATQDYTLTLYNGASIATASPAPYSPGYLSINVSSGQYASATVPFSLSQPWTISFWHRISGTMTTGGSTPTLFEIGNTAGFGLRIQSRTGFKSIESYKNGLNHRSGIYGGEANDTSWTHYSVVYNIDSYIVYSNGVSSNPTTVLELNVTTNYTYINFGKSNMSSLTAPTGGSFVINIDKFQIFNKTITAGEASSLYGNTFNPTGTPKLVNAASGVSWMSVPGTLVDTSETSYTVKSNEVALTPGTNSTFAVWTATKSTNIKVDVSFADYHTRSAGVGFQIFKINSNNTFGSVLFPRTVTSTALTNAAPSNYLTVPSITTTVNAGDKIYIRVDANGNTTAASSVLATAIYTDDVSVASNPVETKLLQANLGNNLASATLVAGNANTVYDTVGNGNWKFYVAGNTSTAAITGSSASAEWTVGNLLSYTSAPSPPTDFSMNFTFNTDKVSGATITDSSVANYSGTLVGVGATIATTSPSPAPGTGYLSILNTYSPSPVTTNHVALPPITPPTGGMTLSFWLNPRENLASYIIQIGNGQFNNNIIFFLGNNNMFGLVIKGGTQGYNSNVSSTNNINVTNGTWKHVVWTLDPSNIYKFYFNGSLSNTLSGASYYYPNNVTTTQNYIGRSSYAVPYYNGDFDDFRIYNRVLTDVEANAVFMAGAQSKFSDATTGVTWMPIPATLVDASETNYTVKSNEIALLPGTNSTYAVWTAPKSTNLKIDVSFADYHSRSAGVGFQMFKINSDNTFGSVIFPRTVTSTALTNANPTNYLSVPSRTISVATGDKIYLRIDANGNTTAASSVLATNIYADNNYIPPLSATNVNESKVLQAHLGNNLAAATSLVSGNANTVLDTVGTGDWKFYVSGNTSVASVTGASNSSEWTGGSLLSYNEFDYYMFYPFNTNTVSGNTLLNKATNSYDATLYGGASIINTVPSPAAQPPAIGTGYLEMNVGAGQYAELTQSVSLNQSGSTISLWFKYTSNIINAPLFQYGNGNDFLILYMWTRDWCNIAWRIGVSQSAGYAFHAPSLSIPVGSWVHFALQTSTGNIYVNGVSNGSINGFSSMPQPTYFYFGNYNPVTSNIGGLTNDFSIKTGTISMDNFVIYNKTLTVPEIGALYSKSDIYYTFDSDSVSGTSVGNKTSGVYAYDATLVNSASIGTSNPSSAPTTGTGHLQLTSTNTIATNQYVQLTFQPSFFGYKSSFSVSFWARSNNATNGARCKPFDFSKPVAGGTGGNVGHSIYISGGGLVGLIFHDATGTNFSEYTMYTSPSLVSDNIWRHYVWTVYGDFGQTVEWKFYVNSVLVFTKTGGFPNGGAPNGETLTSCFIGRDAATWHNGSFTGAIDEFRWYKSRVIGQSEVSNLYATQVSVGKFQNPSGGSPTWIAKPATPVDATETLYTVKSNEIALAPGTNSTYAVWTAPKPTNIRVDVSFADYHSRSAGVGFQMFKINSDNTFGSVIFPRTVTSTALTNANPTNYLSVPSRSLSVATGDKIYYRVDANGNTTAASSVLATNIYSYSGVWS